MHDAHFHIDGRIMYELRRSGIIGIANVQNPDEFEEYKKLKLICPDICFSAGVHPWDAAKINIDEMTPVIEEADFVGEIGLDRVWCEVPYSIQQEVFIRQLEMAERLKKPVILHTKGREAEVLKEIRRYPNTYIVHWYSSMEYLEGYLELDTYFTVGPSAGRDEAVNNVCRKVPIERLLTESDGIDAVCWASGEPSANYTGTLCGIVDYIAKVKGILPEAAGNTLDVNFKAIIKRRSFA